METQTGSNCELPPLPSVPSRFARMDSVPRRAGIRARGRQSRWISPSQVHSSNLQEDLQFVSPARALGLSDPRKGCWIVIYGFNGDVGY